MHRRVDNLPTGSREEEKTTSYLSIGGEQYRIVYSKVYGDSTTKDILKIEIASNFKLVVPHVKRVIAENLFKRIHVFVRYAEFLKLNAMEQIDKELNCEGFAVEFVFIPRHYELDEFVLLYDVCKIE